MAGTYSRSTEVLVIGGGPGGYVAAIRLGQLGKKVLLIERRELGGDLLVVPDSVEGEIPRRRHSWVATASIERKVRVVGVPEKLGVSAPGACGTRCGGIRHHVTDKAAVILVGNREWRQAK